MLMRTAINGKKLAQTMLKSGICGPINKCDPEMMKVLYYDPEQDEKFIADMIKNQGPADERSVATTPQSEP